MFTLTIDTDNAAFHGAECPDEEHECPKTEAEIARILRIVTYQAEGGFRHYSNRGARNDAPSGYIDDVNGNAVGYWVSSHAAPTAVPGCPDCGRPTGDPECLRTPATKEQ